jgi:class 3 adenylate cyclase
MSLMNSRGGCGQPASRYCEQHYSCARCIRNILEQASVGGERPVGLPRTSSNSEPELEIIVALRVGTAFYGNVGAADRLDFTVIGPAVNLVSPIEAVGKALNVPIIVSDDFARSYGKPLYPLGRHVLRGLATPPRTICTGFATVRCSSPAKAE